MRIPEIRAHLAIIADYLEENHRLLTTATQIRNLSHELKRRPSSKTDRRVSVPLTPKVRAKIIQMRHDLPGISQMEIASFVGVNPGRVSEVLRGFRT
jgi:hypothetical protein